MFAATALGNGAGRDLKSPNSDATI